MPKPSTSSREQARGDLTPAQHEIMSLVWESGATGLTVAEIWQAITAGRDVARTTVLNLVDRLEKRGWLTRRPTSEGLRYAAAVDRAATKSRLAADFVADFFGGSSVQLVQSLLGSRSVSPQEIERLRSLLAETKQPKSTRLGRKS
jgi:predicted transcriptional regulator